MLASPLSSSFICSSVFVTSSCKGAPCVSNFKYPSHNVTLTGVPKLQFVLHTSGALDLFPIVQRGKNSHLFIGVYS